jgi:hypothetical protein
MNTSQLTDSSDRLAAVVTRKVVAAAYEGGVKNVPIRVTATVAAVEITITHLRRQRTAR